MTALIEKQKVAKRIKTGSLLKTAKLKVEAKEFSKQKPAKRKRFFKPIQNVTLDEFLLNLHIKSRIIFKKIIRGKIFTKKVLISLGTSMAMAGLLITAYFVNTGQESLEIALPDDTILKTHLMDYASVEFSGQGSGEILPAASVLIPAVNPETYTVQPGDTISGIAKKYGLTEGTLIGYNSVTDVYRLIPGTELNVPDIDGMPYQVKNGDSISSIAEHFNVSFNDILDANDLDNDVLLSGQNLFIPGARISDYDYKKATKTLFIYPASGRLSSGYGYRSDPFTGARRFHYGIDLANSTGTAVRATMEGTIIDVQDRTTGYGKCVIIRHANGFQTLYGHMDSINVRKNQWVEQGQLLGRMGSTGRSTGPHLHFSIYKNNNPINPLNYLYR